MNNEVKTINGYSIKDETARNSIQNLSDSIPEQLNNVSIKESNLSNDYYQYRTERKIVFEEYGQLVPQIRGVQGACTDGTYLYWCDWTNDSTASALVKSNLDGTEISRITMTTIGHPNSITYCNKDECIYVNFTSEGIDVYNKSDLSYVKSITGFYSANSICWYNNEEMFLFHRSTSSSYYYIDYDVLHGTSFYNGYKTRDWNMVYRFSTPSQNAYVQQGDCIYGDVIYRCADRSRFNKTAQIQKFSSTGDYLGEIICDGLGTNEIESIIITENYVYAIAYDNKKIYRASINDTSNLPITYSYVQTSWNSIIYKKGAKVSGYVNNNSSLPSTIEEEVNSVYHLKHVPFYTGNIQKIHFILQTQGYRAIPLTLTANYVSGSQQGFDTAMTYIDGVGDIYYVKLKGTISEALDGNTDITLSTIVLNRDKRTVSESVVTLSELEFQHFRICGIVVEY